MATYTQKAVQHEATQFVGQDLGIGHREYIGTDDLGMQVWQLIIPTDGGEITARMNDYVVTTDSGPIAVNPDDFDKRYKPYKAGTPTPAAVAEEVLEL